MKRKYVKLNKKGMWHVGTKTIWTMCGRAMPCETIKWGIPYYALWAEAADQPDGPVCKTCLKALAAWEREFGERDESQATD